MRILYIGAVDFSYHCLQEILKAGGDVVGVVTSNSPRSNSDYKDLEPLANNFNIPVYRFENINDKKVIDWINNKKPDIIFCFGISQIIKKQLLNIPPMGVVGVHPALLPQNRGRHPLIWAKILGLKESGLTFFFMDEGTDSGDILSQRSFEIYNEDNAMSLYNKIKDLATIQIKEFLPLLIQNRYSRIKQENDRANYWRKRIKEDGVIDWRMSEQAILNLVKALSPPYPGAEFFYKGQKVIVRDAIKYEEKVECNIEPGKVIKVMEGRPIIKCYDGAIMLTDLKTEAIFNQGEYV